MKTPQVKKNLRNNKDILVYWGNYLNQKYKKYVNWIGLYFVHVSNFVIIFCRYRSSILDLRLLGERIWLITRHYCDIFLNYFNHRTYSWSYFWYIYKFSSKAELLHIRQEDMKILTLWKLLFFSQPLDPFALFQFPY